MVIGTFGFRKRGRAAAAVEVEIPGTDALPRTIAGDQVAYVVLDGELTVITEEGEISS